MGILYTSMKRFTDPQERVSYSGLDLLAQGTAVIEPESIGVRQWVDADVATLMAGVPTAIAGTIVKDGDLVVDAGTSVLLDEQGDGQGGSTVDTVVSIAQSYDRIYLTGYIEIQIDGVTGAEIPKVRIVAHNIENSAETIFDTNEIKFATHYLSPTLRARTAFPQLTVSPNKRWLDSNGDPLDPPPVISVANMNLTALPSITIPDGIVGEQELNGTDIQALAAIQTGQRAIFTTPGLPTNVPAGSRTTIGTVTFDPTDSAVCQVGQIGISPLLAVRVTDQPVTTVTIYAYNLSTVTQHVPANTQIKVFLY